MSDLFFFQVRPTVISGGGGVGTDPASVSGLKLWLKADAIIGLVDGDLMTQWDDLSGNGYHYNASGGLRPAYKTNIANGKPAVLFSGAQYLTGTARQNLLTSFHTIFIVAQATDVSLANSQYFFSDGGARVVLFTATDGHLTGNIYTSGTVGAVAGVGKNGETFVLDHMHKADVGSNDVFVRRTGGHLENSGVANLSTLNAADPTYVGGRSGASRYLTGYIFEVIVYDNAISDADRDGIRTYLHAKYGLTDFIPTSISGCTLWCAADNTEFFSDAEAVGALGWNSEGSYIAGNFTQSTANRRPTFQTEEVNGRPVVRFVASPAGEEDLLTGQGASNFISTSAYTFFAVVKPSAGGGTDGSSHYHRRPSIIQDANRNWHVGIYDSKFCVNHNTTTGPGLLSSTFTPGNWYIVEAYFGGGTVGLKVNNSTPVTASSGTLSSLGNLAFGQGQDAYFDGDIAEIIGWNVDIGSTDRTTVRNRLAAKYGITLSP